MDRYTKVVLTVIAVALVWLCLWGAAPKWGAIDVNIIEVAGNDISQGRGLRRSPALPVRVEGTVDVEGLVEVEGRVGIDGTVNTCEMCAY